MLGKREGERESSEEGVNAQSVHKRVCCVLSTVEIWFGSDETIKCHDSVRFKLIPKRDQVRTMAGVPASDEKQDTHLLIDSLHDFVDDVLCVGDERDAVQRVLGLGAARHDPRRLA